MGMTTPHPDDNARRRPGDTARGFSRIARPPSSCEGSAGTLAADDRDLAGLGRVDLDRAVEDRPAGVVGEVDVPAAAAQLDGEAAGGVGGDLVLRPARLAADEQQLGP